ncbi:BAR/IMD domain-containing adapter protein 2-like 2 [Enoplosus armatus]|uniref:BAR/IMD domain-containing adapter protein 2-like 2 n=1 Tax=Enoplosus armatus TaxID=215367 RepID=UPI003994A5E2
MSGMNSDQLHRSTLGIYSSLMDEFNPSLQKLVSLGNSYIQAFQAFALTSEAYFSALSKIGEKAFHTLSSHSLGDILVQISESQRRLTMELEGVFHWFSVEVLQQMDNNIRLDKDYISGSRKHYEMEVHNQAAALERQLRRGANQDCREYVQFLRESHGEALKEEERRHRFLAEKHCGLIQSIAHLMNKTGGSLQQRADAWSEEVNATRGPEAQRPATVDSSMGMKEEEVRKSREELTLGSIPSRAPSPQGSISCSRAESVGGGGGGRSMRARVAHQPGGSNPTLLPFTRGEMITVLVQQPRNGWLYGHADSGSRQGWFPASYVEAVDDPPRTTSSGNSALRGSSSVRNRPDQQGSSGHSGAPPPPPPPPSLSSNKQSEMRPITPTRDRRAESNSENKRSKPHGSQPELFPKGTNPFATVKLKPTSTNDRSAPRLNRR